MYPMEEIIPLSPVSESGTYQRIEYAIIKANMEKIVRCLSDGVLDRMAMKMFEKELICEDTLKRSTNPSCTRGTALEFMLKILSKIEHDNIAYYIFIESLKELPSVNGLANELETALSAERQRSTDLSPCLGMRTNSVVDSDSVLREQLLRKTAAIPRPPSSLTGSPYGARKTCSPMGDAYNPRHSALSFVHASSAVEALKDLRQLVCKKTEIVEESQSGKRKRTRSLEIEFARSRAKSNELIEEIEKKIDIIETKLTIVQKDASAAGEEDLVKKESLYIIHKQIEQLKAELITKTDRRTDCINYSSTTHTGNTTQCCNCTCTLL